MQENEFEKKLQQKMEALQVQPDEAVWQNVKAQVAQKKRRRKFAFAFLSFFVIASALLVADSYNLFDIKQPASLAVSKNEPRQSGGKENTVPPAAATASDPNAAGANFNEQENITINKKKAANNHAQKTGKPISGNAIAANYSTQASAITERKQNLKVRANTKQMLKTTVANAQPEDETEKKDIAMAEQAPSAIKENNPPPVVEQKNDNENNIAEAEQTMAKETKLTEAINKQAKEKHGKKPGKQKWAIGFSFSGGFSSAPYNNTEKNLAYADNLGSIPVTGNANGNNYYYPSVARKAFGFNAGIEVSRSLSNKVKLVTGLQYQVYSTSQKTGRQIISQTRSNTTFAYGTTNIYTNKFHYINLPAGIDATVFSIGKKAVSAGAGINFSRLLKANTLAFDTTSGYYYNNQSLLNKTFISLSASLSVNLAAKNKPAFYIGPQFYYSITPLANTGMYAATHSSFIGIRLQKNITGK